jgi:hypothetical protein
MKLSQRHARNTPDAKRPAFLSKGPRPFLVKAVLLAAVLTATSAYVFSNWSASAAGPGYGEVAGNTLAAQAAEAPSLVVTTTADVVADDGLTSLREAIAYAEIKDGDDIITFDIPKTDPGYDAVSNKYTITLAGTQLVVNSSVQINGPADSGVIISGNNASRVFYINERPSPVTVGFSNLTIKGGKAPAREDGGGIYNNRSDLTLTGCTVSGNASGSDTNAGNGGGIYNDRYTVTLINSTVSGNTTGTGEHNGGDGAGIYTQQGTVNINNSTVSDNTTGSGGTSGGNGGGVFNNAGTVNLRSSIVAGNGVSAFGTGTDLRGTFNSQDYNFVQNTSGATFTGTTTHNVTGLDPHLGALQDNGGPTETCALLPGSRAIDAGVADGLLTDQRGLARTSDDPAAWNAAGSDGTDIGAFEAQNRKPSAHGQTVTTAEDTPLLITLSATDADQDALSFTVTNGPTHGALDTPGTPDCTTTPGTCTATVNYTPSPDYNGADGFTFKAGDGHTDSEAATVSVNVTAVNDPPTISDIANQTTAQDTPTAAIPFAVGDVDTPLDGLAVSGASSNPTLVPDANIAFGGGGASRTVTVTPAAGKSGTSTITVTVNDGSLAASDTFLLTVTAAPTPTPTPEITPTPTPTPEITPTPTPETTPTPTPTPETTPTPTPTPTPEITPTPTPETTPTPTPTPQPGVVVEFTRSDFEAVESCAPTRLTVGVNIQAAFAGAVTIDQPVTVDYAVTGGTASQKSDYTYVAGTVIADGSDNPKFVGTLTFDPGETTKDIEVLVNEDGYAEGDENVVITLSNPRGAALGERKSATLTIHDNDAADSETNPIDDSRNFVCQQYHDFLHRQPDEAGWQFWTDNIESCGADAGCRAAMRANVSSAFFLSIEYQATGYFVDRLYEACLNRRPHYEEYIHDMHAVGLGVQVGVGDWQQRLEANKQTFAESFVQRDEFTARYPGTMAADEFVNEMYEYAGVEPTDVERQAATDAFGAGGTKGRAAAMRAAMESASVYRAYYNRGFVLGEYFGYLRRDPNAQPDADWAGYDFWLAKLEAFSLPGEDVTQEGDAFARVQRAEMVRAFIESVEYRQRFGRP